MTNQEFIEFVGNLASKDMKQTGILASLTVAQAIKESAWGKSELALNANALFGIKHNSDWSGKVYNKDTGECYDGKNYVTVNATFRAYDDWRHSINDHSEYLTSRKIGSKLRYEKVICETDYKKACHAIKQAGYATGLNYAEGLISLIEQHNLTRFDTERIDVVEKYLIALDDGHGMETAGKRTPKLPDGSVMKENEFNRVVVNYLDAELKRCGFDTLLVAPTDEDTPLSTRVAKANNANAKAYISIHANAYDGSFDGKNPEGIETFYFDGSGDGKELATEVHSQLITGANQVSRGIKPGNHLYVIRWTHMPAILIEAAFMDNPREVELLRSDSFRKECAVEICKGICSYFEVAYVAENVTIPVPEQNEGKKLYRVQVGAFKNRSGAEKLSKELKDKGYSNFITL